MLETLPLLGEHFLRHMLVPTLAWTAAALPTLFVLRRARRLHPDAQQAARTALALALPLCTALTLVDMPALGALAARVAPGAVLTLPEVAAADGPDATGWTLAHGLGAIAVLSGLASAAALVRLCGQVVGVVRLRRRLRYDVPRHAVRLADELARGLGIRRRVRLARLEAGRVPFTAGIVHPVVALPEPLLAEPERLRMTLLHELVHVGRLDVLRAGFDAGLAALWCWHPLVHRLRAELARYREETCDATVLATHAVRPRAYAGLLLDLATPAHPSASLAPAAALGMASLDVHLKPRIEAMTRHTGTPTRPLPTLVLSLFLLLGTLGLSACADAVSDAPAAPGAEIEAQAISGEAISDLDVRPEIIGGIAAVQEQIVYPALAKKAGLEGRVLVRFVVDTEGVPRDVEVVKGLGGGLDAEARRAVQAIRFTPGEQDGQKVPVELMLPITFRLPDADA